VDWVEGAGVYVNLHVAGKELLYRASLSELAENLDPAQFVRVHRSAIVNVDSIVRLESLSHGEFAVVLKDGAQSRVSRPIARRSRSGWVNRFDVALSAGPRRST